MEEDSIEKIKNDVLNCNKCSLSAEKESNGYFSVIGEGDIKANILFVGEAPGFNEAKTGKPFCGRAGKILDELLSSADIKREDVYIANILKCRPPKNRDPLKDEIEACTPYLLRQINVINPKVICTLGNYATAFMMKKYGFQDNVEGISKIHGKVFEIKDLFKSIRIIPLYHPAVATYNINMMGVLKEDFKVLENFK
jgi:DNA polymerase